MQDNIYQPSEKSILIQLMDTEPLLTKYEHDLRGEVLTTKKEKDSGGKEVITQSWERKYPAKMNDVGVTSCMAFLRIICDKVISMTDLDEEMANMLSNQNCDSYWTFLCVNYANFGLKSESQLTEAYLPVKDLIITRFQSCKDGMFPNAIAKTTNVTEDKSVGTQQNNNGNNNGPNILNKLWPRV